MRSLTDVIKGSLSRAQTYSAVPSANLEKSSRASDEDTLDGQEDSRALMGDEARYPLYHPRRRFTTVMEEVGNELHDVKFNGTLGKNSDFSGHWGDPDEAMDRNWNKWGFVKYVSFSRDEFAAMGMDLEGSAKFTEEYGGGYIGFLEISHQMHCLNVIRQAYHWEYYEKPENKKWATWLYDNPITIKVHINHCFEMLRQLIMCNADLGVIPHHWVKDIQDPYANFNTVHKCRDLDSVAEWIEQHEVPPPPETGYPMPAGSKVWPRPP
ncbi:hypothetical protein F5Y13DRAFT_185759 [Hypoxylon sp. FL1857]|nr:hypothetical protein F5Y13DRAFT_185759 [Hypoxylon sp. FL1857]